MVMHERFADKVMLCIWWYFEGVVFFKQIPDGCALRYSPDFTSSDYFLVCSMAQSLCFLKRSKDEDCFLQGLEELADGSRQLNMRGYTSKIEL